jgi:hypothetical protein
VETVVNATELLVPEEAQGKAFDELPEWLRVRVFGVPYARLQTADEGEFYVTSYGWPLLSNMLPHLWYDDHRYAAEGRRLPGATGTVYAMQTSNERGRKVSMVLKFSRFAQEVPLLLADTLPDDVSAEAAFGARFNGPFEEFGVLADLRRGRFGDPALRVRTKRPLGIYVPATHCKLWQSGRKKSRFAALQHDMRRDQLESETDTRIELDIERDYILLFAYVDGVDAESMMVDGKLEEEEVKDLTARVRDELHEKGFYVLDHKPRHIILRPRNGDALRRHGKLVYALVDFELLHRTPEYEQYLRQRS